MIIVDLDCCLRLGRARNERLLRTPLNALELQSRIRLMLPERLVAPVATRPHFCFVAIALTSGLCHFAAQTILSNKAL